jgi:hypothetical protein
VRTRDERASCARHNDDIARSARDHEKGVGGWGGIERDRSDGARGEGEGLGPRQRPPAVPVVVVLLRGVPRFVTQDVDVGAAEEGRQAAGGRGMSRGGLHVSKEDGRLGGLDLED